MNDFSNKLHLLALSPHCDLPAQPPGRKSKPHNGIFACQMLKQKATACAVAFFGGPGGIRTLDLCDANAALSQLSYRPIFYILPILPRLFPVKGTSGSRPEISIIILPFKEFVKSNLSKTEIISFHPVKKRCTAIPAVHLFLLRAPAKSPQQQGKNLRQNFPGTRILWFPWFQNTFSSLQKWERQ